MCARFILFYCFVPLVYTTNVYVVKHIGKPKSPEYTRIPQLSDHYYFRPQHSARAREVKEDPQVEWIQEQHPRVRNVRNFTETPCEVEDDMCFVDPQWQIEWYLVEKSELKNDGPGI